MTAENRSYIKGTKTALNTIMFFLLFKKKVMVARFPVISREEILNFVKEAISKNAVKTINFFSFH